ncbi:MAG: hypothetical protein IT306_24080 [Chloroflexi bacterium]|nr:hypothetical protein [Chloroflexota bacterium]
MTLFIQNDATGAGAGSLNPNQAAVDLAVAANGDTGLGLAAAVGNRQQVTYAQTLPGGPPTRLSALVNTNFTPNFGAGPQNVNIVILPVLANFVLNDGTSILTVGGTALPPAGSGLAGAGLNNTTDCLVIYDTTQNNGNGYCTARNGTGGTLDLPTPNPIILFHELSHAFRIVTNALLALSATCNPSSPEENAAIVDENTLRTQVANATGVAVVLRDPGIHCGTVCGAGGGGSSCCIIASVASGSPLSAEVAALRSVRDNLLRRTEIGFASLQALLRDYYGFSPQVSTLMARYPALQRLVLEGYVRPLIQSLRLIERYALGGDSADALGAQFVADHADRVTAAMRLSLLQRARGVIQGEMAWLDDGDETERELARLLQPGLASEHVRWGLLEPVDMYLTSLEAHLDGCSPLDLGERLAALIDAWGARMPLDDVWASLTVAQLQEELAAMERTLLRNAAASKRFRERLLQAYGSVTAVATVLGDGALGKGDV